MQKTGLVIKKLIKWVVYGMFFLTIFTVVIALFSNDTKGEAGICWIYRTRKIFF